MIAQDHAEVILAAVISSNALAMAPIAQNHHIPLLATIATHPKVTDLGDYIFRICLMDSFQGKVMAQFALDVLKLRKIAILRDMKSDYSMGLAETFAAVFKAGGGTILMDQSYSAGDIDFKSQLTQFDPKSRSDLPTRLLYGCVFDCSTGSELAIDVPLLGGDGWDSPKLKEIGGLL